VLKLNFASNSQTLERGETHGGVLSPGFDLQEFAPILLPILELTPLLYFRSAQSQTNRLRKKTHQEITSEVRSGKATQHTRREWNSRHSKNHGKSKAEIRHIEPGTRTLRSFVEIDTGKNVSAQMHHAFFSL
jgi:hypothetical protein